jgi:hypothetical protein
MPDRAGGTGLNQAIRTISIVPQPGWAHERGAPRDTIYAFVLFFTSTRKRRLWQGLLHTWKVGVASR